MLPKIWCFVAIFGYYATSYGYLDSTSGQDLTSRMACEKLAVDEHTPDSSVEIPCEASWVLHIACLDSRRDGRS